MHEIVLMRDNFKTGEVWQPHAGSVRLRGRYVPKKYLQIRLKWRLVHSGWYEVVEAVLRKEWNSSGVARAARGA
jgi:hypothetical protein